MFGYIDGFDFYNMEAQKYWSFPSSYDLNKRKEQLNTMLYSNDYVASEKRDGYWQMVLKDEEGTITMRARSSGVNGWVCKQDWVPQFDPFFEALPNGTCLICEVYIPGGTSKMITTILGCSCDKAIQRQKVGTPLRLSVFDVLAWGGKKVSNLAITERIKYLDNVRALQSTCEYIDVVDYWNDPIVIHDKWLEILSAGGEGVVLTRKDNPYEFGKRTARHTLKMKKELEETIDVFLTGTWKDPTKLYSGKDIENWEYWYDELSEERINKPLSEIKDNTSVIPVTRLWFNNMAGAVEIATIIDNKIAPIGWISGVSDDIRKQIVENPESLKGSVVELQAMEVDNTGAYPTLRHAKIVKWRPDKNWKDCVWNG